EENNTIDTAVKKLGDIKKELRLNRAGHEEWDWPGEVENSEIDLEDIEETE
ncbi:unnamed protein product, partial [marine sediment metagenome]